ncbi:MAG TPA: hypothetical protein VL283_03280 [Candidatus Baltobacteraceae bacterium]|nr:hypothetical protein [Candidatus Baltobacteraceae bacterium]
MAKKGLMKGLALATMVAGAVALAHAKNLGGVSKKSYAKIVDSVLGEYAKMKTFTKQEIADLSHDLKDGWDDTAKMLHGRKG